MSTVTDVIVVGAGLAGLTAARRSQQLGASVLVIDKGLEHDANATRRSGGLFHAAYFDPRHHTPDELFTAIVRSTDGHARPDVARAWADNVLRALQFLSSEGAHFEKAGESESDWNRNGPPPLVTKSLLEREPRWRGAANDRLLQRMAGQVVAGDGTVRSGTRATELILDDGAVAGVRVGGAASADEVLRGRAVIMADGGFQANRALVSRFITPHPYSLLCSDLATGDCLQMAMAIGARTIELDAAYQWVVLRDMIDHPRLAHPPSPTWLINAAMCVDGNGDRIGDETLPSPPDGAGAAAYPSNQYSDKRLAGRMAKAEAGGNCWVVFDTTVWDTAGRRTGPEDSAAPAQTDEPGLALNPILLEHGGTLLSADSIADLAACTGLPADRLQRTVEAFNRFSREGIALDPLRTRRPQPIANPPFYAIPVVPGIFFTMGGVLVNEHGQALDEHEKPIPGLYAAGGTMGGLQGGPHQGYAGGWSEAATFGLLSAEHASRTVLPTSPGAADPVAATRQPR